MKWLIWFIGSLTCKHDLQLVRTIHGDEINHRNGMRSEWACKKCHCLRYSKSLDRMEP